MKVCHGLAIEYNYATTTIVTTVHYNYRLLLVKSGDTLPGRTALARGAQRRHGKRLTTGKKRREYILARSGAVLLVVLCAVSSGGGDGSGGRWWWR